MPSGEKSFGKPAFGSISRRSSYGHERHAEDAFFQLGELIARPGRLLELEVLGVLHHLLLARLDLTRELLLAHRLVARLLPRRAAHRLRVLRLVHALDKIIDALH